MRWDPHKYGEYADERARPFVELVDRIGTVAPRRVVDLGCGPGTLTARLATRWPEAVVEGVDSSAEMIAHAREQVPGLHFHLADVRDWSMPEDCDVVVCNATLQWVPGHQGLLTDWARALPPGGWLAMQVPGNFTAPSHVLMRSLAESSRWAPLVGDVLRHRDAVATPERYARLLLDAGLRVDVWETTYLHRLAGADPVLEWVRGTGLRPVLAALSGKTIEEGTGQRPAAEQFEAEYGALLRQAYPGTEQGTLFGFRRVFAVGHKPS